MSKAVDGFYVLLLCIFKLVLRSEGDVLPLLVVHMLEALSAANTNLASFSEESGGCSK